MSANGLVVDFALLKTVVDTNIKRRFALSEDQSRIRANQGHSIKIDLGYKPVTPPDVLYHGTAVKNIESILRLGIKKRTRHHVHLSADIITAKNVGVRHGKPIVLLIDSFRMNKEGHKFFESKNGVWLTDEIAVEYISKM